MLSVLVYSASGVAAERERKDSSRSSVGSLLERMPSGNGSPSPGGGFFAPDRYSIATDGSSDAAQSQVNPVLVVKYCGSELFRTSVAYGTADPVWNEELHVKIDDVFSAETERENQRLFFFEYLDVEVWDYGKTKLCETVVPLIDTEQEGSTSKKGRDSDTSAAPQGKVYKLVLPLHQVSRRGADGAGYVRLRLRLKTLDVNMLTELARSRRALLLELYPPDTYRQYRHLFSLFDWSPADMYGCSPLAGPALGERVLEKHDCVEWLVAAGQSAFGDRYSIRVAGTLLLTDLRLLFLPKRVDAPPWLQLPILSYAHNPQTSAAGWGEHCDLEPQMSSEEALLVKRLTYQMPIPAVQEFSAALVDTGSGGGGCSRITVVGRDGSVVEFSVVRRKRRPRGAARGRQSIYRNHNGHAVDRSAMERSIFESYCGLASDSMHPHKWCERVQNQLRWLQREGRTWVRWMRYTTDTHSAFCGSGDAWLRRSRAALSVERDYHRLLKPFNSWCDSWTLHDVNHRYMLCDTYPQLLALPSVLDLCDIEAAASQRSKSRLPALVWIHPISKVPLCRAAQPLSGLSGRLATEADVKMCLAIKHHCPTGKQLRIADARPRLNANANALAGKGFESVAAFGGPSVVQLAFLDIENIHIMRASLLKLQDGFRSSCSSSADLQDVFVLSKWPMHISLILRGASCIAESVLLGHPVLVHCSDGWDRTAQLSALAQLSLDPHYRTLDGFCALIEKEFCTFGHKFEDRLGDSGSKESSPVFLQFLDGCFQLLSQYPVHFEFTPTLLVLLMQASYSGYFSTFLGNSERERHLLVKEALAGEGAGSDSLAHLSSIFAYAGILARSEALSALFVNPFYVAPASPHEITYLRPRTGVMDMVFWKEGLSGINQSYLHGSLGLFSPSITECGAVAAAISGRKDDYVRVHLPEFAASTRWRYHAISSFQAGLLTATGVHRGGDMLRVLSYRGNSYSANVLCQSSGAIGVLERAAAAERLQLWLFSVRRAAAAAAALGAPSRGVFLSLQVLCLSELKAAKAAAASLANLHIRAVAEVVEELLAAAFNRCMQIEELHYTHVNHPGEREPGGPLPPPVGPSGLIKAKSSILAAQAALKDSLLQRWNAFTKQRAGSQDDTTGLHGYTR